jgi:hypothetical protein
VSRLTLAVLLTSIALAGCIKQAKDAIAPAPEGVGTLTCREVVEQCDAECSDPLCLNRCTGEGNEAAQGQHAALLDCGQRNGCTDQACMEQSCPTEIATCMGPQPGDMPASSPGETSAPAETPASAPAEGPVTSPGQVD